MRKYRSFCRLLWLCSFVVLIVVEGTRSKSTDQHPIHPSSSSSSEQSETTEPESIDRSSRKSSKPRFGGIRNGRRPGDNNVRGDNTSRGKKSNKSRGKVISLAESINRSTKLYLYPDPERAKASKEQWQRALQEIKNISNPSRRRYRTKSTSSQSSEVGTSPTSASHSTIPSSLESTSSRNDNLDDSDMKATSTLQNLDSNETEVAEVQSSSSSSITSASASVSSKTTNKRLFSQWRQTPSENIPRFEGFASWERMLQDWADDVQEYMDKLEADNADDGYPMSTYGTIVDSSSSSSSSSLSTPFSSIRPEDGTEQVDKKEKIGSPDQVEKRNSGELNGNATTSVSSHLSSTTTTTTPIHHATTHSRKRTLPIPAPAKEGEAVVPYTDISDKSKRIWITTTAALPWMTGTAVNPLLRAAYMTEGREEAGGSVTLMVPWLERRQDQEQVYGSQRLFDTPEEQEQFIRTWLRDTANLPAASEKLRIEWYTAWQNKAENSLYSMGDITALIPQDEVDIMILEEPEHLNWYRAPGESWTDKFQHVVGIIHTNYFVYAQEQPAAFIRAPGMRLLCSWMCRAHCHRIIKLSGTLGQFAPEKELVENVHGIRSSFLDAGREVATRIEAKPNDDPIFGAEAEPSVYFIGKMLWSKGIGSLMELLKYAEESAGIRIDVDMYGGGPDKDAAELRAKSLDVDMKFLGPIDHGELAFSHKIFINPSTSEVLCTTVAEALGMGKFVVIPSHPSNDFFNVFPNCLTYTNKEEFVGNLYYALTHSPEPMTKEYLHALSWEAATERLEAAGSIPVEEAKLMNEALSSDDARVEISLPPLIEDEEGRKLVATGLRRSRTRYRQFRSRLSQEVLQSKVLPTRMKERLMSELDKRLEVDIDQVLDSPKLQLQLSPAELDKQLLELYKKVADGPSGDILRVIGGGQEVGLQDLYIKRKAARERVRNPHNQNFVTFGPFQALGDDSDEEKRTASQWVNLVLRRNLPPRSEVSSKSDRQGKQNKSRSKTRLSMWTLPSSSTTSTLTAARYCPPPSSYTRPAALRRSPTASCSLLI